MHGDVRVSNIVFHESSTLIDFDLTRKEDNFYPSNYIYYKKERHSRAKKGDRMKKLHDRYALSCIIKKIIEDVPQVIISNLRNEHIPVLELLEQMP